MSNINKIKLFSTILYPRKIIKFHNGSHLNIIHKTRHETHIEYPNDIEVIPDVENKLFDIYYKNEKQQFLTYVNFVSLTPFGIFTLSHWPNSLLWGLPMFAIWRTNCDLHKYYHKKNIMDIYHLMNNE